MIRSRSADLVLQVIQDAGELRRLESGWRDIYKNHPSLSLFSSFDFIWLWWNHFKLETDSLETIAVWNNRKLAAVVPLMLRKTSYRGVPCTLLVHIGSLDGDRAGIATSIGPAQVWKRVFDYLESAPGKWQMLRLEGIPEEEYPAQNFPWSNNAKFSSVIEPNSVSYYVSLAGSFENYFDCLDNATKQNYRRKLRRAKEQLGSFTFDYVSGQELIESGLSRFRELESRSWKAGAPEALFSNPSRSSFYRSLCEVLDNGRSARLVFLRANGVDIAANLLFQFGSKLYARQRIYDGKYSGASPGILNNVEVIRRHFGCGLSELDMMSTPYDQGTPHHKADWATGKTTTVKISSIVNRSRLFPLAAMKRFGALRKTSARY